MFFGTRFWRGRGGLREWIGDVFAPIERQRRELGGGAPFGGVAVAVVPPPILPLIFAVVVRRRCALSSAFVQQSPRSRECGALLVSFGAQRWLWGTNLLRLCFIDCGVTIILYLDAPFTIAP